MTSVFFTIESHQQVCEGLARSDRKMRFAGLVAGMIVVVLCVGCQNKKPTYDQDARSRLFQKYLNGSLEEARDSLKEELKTIQADSVLSENGKAAQLFIAYTRLYWLEKRSGNSHVAQELLEKARHWNVVRFELEGSSKEEAASKARSIDPESMGEQIDKLDRSANNGKPPRFSSSFAKKDPR